MKTLRLKSGAEVLVDDEDFDFVSQYSWHVSHNGYAIRRAVEPSGRKRVIYMHKELMTPSPGHEIDHADMNKLNNCRSNLREASRTLNNANHRPREGCSSKFKGVAWHKNYKRWWSYINKNGKRLSLGYFYDEVEAAKAYNAAAQLLFGEFARPNVI